MTEFLQMGGYAQYVWPCFGLTFAVLIVNIVTARRRLTAQLDALRLQQARQAQRSAQA